MAFGGDGGTALVLEGATFCVSRRGGDIAPDSPHGLFVADARLDAVTFVGQVDGVEVIRVDARRPAVEALAGLDLPPDAALATLSVLDPAGELRWAS